MQIALLTILQNGAQWNVAVFYPLIRMALKKDKTPQTTHLAKLQAAIFALDALASKWFHL